MCLYPYRYVCSVHVIVYVHVRVPVMYIDVRILCTYNVCVQCTYVYYALYTYSMYIHVLYVLCTCTYLMNYVCTCVYI